MDGFRLDGIADLVTSPDFFGLPLAAMADAVIF